MAPASTTTANDEKAAREACTVFRRFVFVIVNLITLCVTAVYVSHAYEHNKVIDAHPSILKQPNGNFELSLEKVGYAFGIGRTIFLFLTIVPILGLPDWCLFVFSVLNLAFEIPLGFVANSNFGYMVSFSQLDMSPPTVLCYAQQQSPQVWDFFTQYGKVVGKSPFITCQEFSHEGSLLRGSLLFAWYSLWIPFFLIAMVAAMCKQEKHWSDFLVYFTGIDFSWAGFKQCFVALKPKISVPRLRRRKSIGSGSESSTLADEILVTVHGKDPEKA